MDGPDLQIGDAADGGPTLGHIGIAAVSPEGAALTYRQIFREASRLFPDLDPPRVTVHNEPLGVYIRAVRSDDWPQVAGLLARSANVLSAAGADVVITPDNAVQHAVRIVEHESAVPWLAVTDLVAEAVVADGRGTVGVLGTRWVTQGSAYQTALGLKGVKVQAPEGEDIETLDRVIFEELIYGVVKPASRAALEAIVGRLADRGSEALIVALSEASLVLDLDHAGLPVYDASALLARGAVERVASAGG
ncbi:MAG: aspartate/glutamate racemase family protein [Planctomycetota bacterium]